MALAFSFKTLYLSVRTLHELLMAARMTIVEDKPLEGDVVLTDVLGDAIEDMLGWTSKALASAREGQQDLEESTDLEYARRTLSACHESMSRVSRRYFSDLVSYERLAKLNQLGRERRGEWQAWARSAIKALEACRQPFYGVDQALFSCWQELAERASVASVSVRATNIGQQVRLPEKTAMAPEEMA